MLAGIGYLQRAILSSLSQHSYTSPGSPCCLYVKRVEMWSHDIINSFVDFCHQAHLGVQVEAGSTLTSDGSRSRPADVLVRDWIAGRFAAFDFTVSSGPLPSLLLH